ncbi:serine hydrolase domain-containing protein [Paenibacillaceae bacterium WGS1546]|uniref:serine hydrolase domain-containing protein n=1 Tax=Cohnella sp. WGS1546 TaxID=3366810 RepID=UPI00372D7DFD
MDFKPLASFLDRITAWRIPWSEVLVMHRNETVFRYRTGFADLEAQTPIDEGGIFNLYSMTKIMTCVAALQLVEKGSVLLSDPISAYLPEYTEMVVRKSLPGGEELEKAEKPIRVRDLFAMTAGFSYDFEAPSIREAVNRTNGKLPTRAFAEALAKEPLLFEPGTRWNYSLCHDVLAALVEAVDGRLFGVYIRDEITGPLGMNDTGFDLTTNGQRSRLVPQYIYDDTSGLAVRKDGNEARIGTAFEGGGAGLMSTVSDYARFLNALTNRGASPDGIRLLSPAAVDLLRTDQLTDSMRGDFDWEHMKGYGYGLGVRTHISKAASGSLSSLGEFGWAGLAGCMAIVDPAAELTVMYAQHLLNSQEPYVHPRLRNLVYACLAN